MADNTNNSLSDLNNNGYKFNKMLNDDKGGELDSGGRNEVSNIEYENRVLLAKLKNSKDEKDKETIQQKIDRNNTFLNNVKKYGLFTDNNGIFNKTDANGKPTPTSLFDRDAYIDYARYINPPNKWNEYKKADNRDFIVNNNAPINEPVLSRDSSLFAANNPNFSNEGLSIDNLITWSEKYPALQLRYQDFIYCKRLGYYPNNRLIVLRRFKGGVPDNLFDYYRQDSSKIKYTQPLATMITWLKPDENIISLEFHEVWAKYSNSFIETVKNSFNDIKSVVPTESEGKKKKAGYEDLLTSLSLETGLKLLGGIASDLKKEDNTNFYRSAEGNPNLITNAKKRETGGDGLTSTITFEVTFEYELRYINQIDPSIAMLDLISNAMRMGTSESEFRYNIPFLKNNASINTLLNGDMSKALSVLNDNMKKFSENIVETLKKEFNNLMGIMDIKSIGSVILNGLDNSAIYIISRYREELKAALSVDTGLASGIWHITIGNPKMPIISCGDLIIDRSTLTLGKEFGYNDFPNSFEIKYNLQFARERGRNELVRIMNSGRGRTYVYPKASDNPDYDMY